MKPGEEEHNLEKTGMIVRTVNNRTMQMITWCSAKNSKNGFISCAPAWRLTLRRFPDRAATTTKNTRSQAEGGTALEVSDSMEKDEQEKSDPRTSADEEDDEERHHQKELRMMKDHFERQFPREKEKMMQILWNEKCWRKRKR